jgi:phage terminase Nu1 subunit (DNA packaging protein)
MKSEQVTQSEAARRLGMTPQSLGMWARKPGAPVILDGGRPKCLWPAFPRWYADQREENGKGRGAPKSLDEARLRKETAEAELKELELAERRGELMTVDEAARALADAFGRAASKLKNLPRAIALRVTGGTIPEREAQAQPLVDEVSAELATGEDVPGEDEPETTEAA